MDLDDETLRYVLILLKNRMIHVQTQNSVYELCLVVKEINEELSIVLMIIGIRSKRQVHLSKSLIQFR